MSLKSYLYSFLRHDEIYFKVSDSLKNEKAITYLDLGSKYYHDLGVLKVEHVSIVPTIKIKDYLLFKRLVVENEFYVIFSIEGTSKIGKLEINEFTKGLYRTKEMTKDLNSLFKNDK